MQKRHQPIGGEIGGVHPLMVKVEWDGAPTQVARTFIYYTVNTRKLKYIKSYSIIYRYTVVQCTVHFTAVQLYSPSPVVQLYIILYSMVSV